MGMGFRAGIITFGNHWKLSAFQMSKSGWAPVLDQDPNITNIVLQGKAKILHGFKSHSSAFAALLTENCGGLMYGTFMG